MAPAPPSATAAAHVREHRSVLAAPEKRLLVWIARRVPAWIGPDHLTLLGLGSMVAGGLSLATLRTELGVPAVLLCLVLNWLGDSLDGTLARVRDEQRPRYGYYVDHVIDMAGASALLAGLAASPLMSAPVAAAVLAGYLLVCGESYLATHATGVFRISYLGVGPTELRLLLGIGLTLAAQSSQVVIAGLGPVLVFDVGGSLAALGLGWAFLASAIANARALYRIEPVPRRSAIPERANLDTRGLQPLTDAGRER